MSLASSCLPTDGGEIGRYLTKLGDLSLHLFAASSPLIPSAQFVDSIEAKPCYYVDVIKIEQRCKVCGEISSHKEFH